MTQERISLKHHNRKRNIAIFGAMLLSLAIIGVITVTILLVNVGSLLLSNDSLKQEFKRLVYPLVMIDPPPIDKIEKEENNILLQASIWYAIMNEDNTKYENAELNLLTVPVTDVEAYCAKLFGPGIKLTHTTFGDTLLTYEYDKTKQAYNIPNQSQTGLYTPKITNYTKDGDFYYVTVGYIPPGPSWSGDFSGNKYETEPDKYMQYVIKKDGAKYYIFAILDMPAAVSTISTVNSTASQTVSINVEESSSSDAASISSETASSASSQ